MLEPRPWCACVGAAFVFVLSTCGAAAGQTNVALAKPYTMSPRPNYSLTRDAGDDTQLTDGVITTNNPIWTRTSTVGWSNAAPITIVIDLQSVQPIAGVSFSTAAGKAGVQWPRSIFVLTSDDGKQFFGAADLAAVDAQSGPPASGYAAYRYANNGLHTHGRYVAIVIDPVGPFVFCDEIEVTSGDPAWLALPLTGESTTNLQKYYTVARMRVSIGRRLNDDIQDARRMLAISNADDDLRARLSGALDDAASAISTLPAPDPDTFTTTLPLNDLHANVFAVQGAIARADGLPPVSAWATGPWDYMRPADRPPVTASSGLVQVAAMNGETRAGAVNFFNASDQPAMLSLHLTNSAGTAAAFDLQLYQVQWTDTRDLIPVADALVPMSTDGAWTLRPGMTQQLWLSFTPKGRAPGVYRGFLEARDADAAVARVPIELTVLAGAFPSRPSLHLGGWDYTDRLSYMGITPTNWSALIDQLHALNVDSPWATSSVLPSGTFDASGTLSRPPDTTLFDRWVTQWPGARQYCVFVNVKAALGGIPAASPLFAGAVGQWITFWTAHASRAGIQPNQLVLLLVDEPSTQAQDDLITSWASAIKTAQPGVVLWEDPWFTAPAAAPPRMLQTIDDVTLGRLLIAQQGPTLVSFYQNWASTGSRTLNVYGSIGPVRTLDPYTYHRLQSWVSAQIGATGSFFWSFADDAGGASWNEYQLPVTQATFSPFFLSKTQVTISKHSEAIREGVEDFEYLSALQHTDGMGALFDMAVSTVLQATDWQWTSGKDRSVADSMRLQIAGALGLIPPPPPLAPTVIVGGGVVTYDGQPHAASATVVGSDGSAVAGSIAISYAQGDSVPPVNAGSYAVSVVFTSEDARYLDASATGTLVIQPASPVVNVASVDAVFDGTVHTSSADATGVDGLSVAGSIEMQYLPGDSAPIAVGTYTATAVFTSNDPNYSGAIGIGKVVIGAPPPIAPAVVITGGVLTYDGQPHAASATVVGSDGSVVAGSIVISYTPGDSAPPVNAGTYLVTAIFASSDERYTDASITAALVIQQASPTVTVANVDVIFDGTARNAPANVTGVDGLPIAGAIEMRYVPGDTAPIDVGTYTATAAFTSHDPNYSAATGTGVVVISAPSPADVTETPASSDVVVPSEPVVTNESGGPQEPIATDGEPPPAQDAPAPDQWP